MRCHFLLPLVLLMAPPLARADDADAKKLAEEILAKGASLFDARDSKGLAATYVEDAVFTLFVKDNNTARINAEERRGAVEIEEFYRKIFDGQTGASTSKNHVESARRLSPEVLLIEGRFQPDTTRDDGYPFVQVRVKQGDKWLIKSLQIFALPKS